MASLSERMIGAMQGNVSTFEEVEKDPAALGQAVTVIAIAALASLVGNIFRTGIGTGIIMLVATLIGYAVWTIIVVVVGTKLMPEPGTKADFVEGFRVIGFAASPGVFNVLAIVPFLGPLISFAISLDARDHGHCRAQCPRLHEHRPGHHRVPDWLGGVPDPEFPGRCTASRGPGTPRLSQEPSQALRGLRRREAMVCLLVPWCWQRRRLRRLLSRRPTVLPQRWPRPSPPPSVRLFSARIPISSIPRWSSRWAASRPAQRLRRNIGAPSLSTNSSSRSPTAPAASGRKAKPCRTSGMRCTFSVASRKRLPHMNGV